MPPKKSNTLINFFKSKIKRSDPPDADVHKQVLSSNYDMLVFGKEQDKLDYKSVVIQFLETSVLDLLP
jgi:GTP pyrophosphokinase